MSETSINGSESNSPSMTSRTSVSTKSAKEDARERRRSQVRRAQRAYRSRKESAITTLDQRVKELEDLLRAMQVTCTKLDHALQATSSCSSSMPSSSMHDEEEDTHRHITELKRLLNTALPGQRDGSPSQKLANVKPKSTSNGSPPSLTVEDKPMDPFNALCIDDFPEHTSDTLAMTGGFVYDMSDPLSNVSHLPIPLSLTSIRTYSYQEKSFARRLHRMCLERAVEYLTYPGQHPDQYANTFKLAYSISNRGRMLSRLRCMLHRGTTEALENWAIPFFRIGGAGSFAAWKKATTTPVMYEDVTNEPTAFGPYSMPVTETPQPQGTTLTQLLSAIGFGGAWYDVADVEECLKSNGIVINPEQAFVSVDSSCLNAVKQDVLTLGALHDPAQRTEQQNSCTDLSISNQVQDVTLDVDDWEPSYGRFWPAPSTSMDNIQPLPTRMVLDVDRFLAVLVDRACCLGRAPGFKIGDFWNALLSSTH